MTRRLKLLPPGFLVNSEQKGWLQLGLKFVDTGVTYQNMWFLSEQLNTMHQVLKHITEAHSAVTSVVTISEGGNVIQKLNACAVWALFMSYLGEVRNGQWRARVSSWPMWYGTAELSTGWCPGHFVTVTSSTRECFPQPPFSC